MGLHCNSSNGCGYCGHHVVTTVTVIATTAVLLLLRRQSQNKNDLNHDDKGRQIKCYNVKTSYFICTGKSASVDQQTA